MDVYVINLDRCVDRWERMQRAFAAEAYHRIRISAIDITEQPEFAKSPHFSMWRFRFCMGRLARRGEIGCYASHLKTLRSFLDSGAECALICEDDVLPTECLPEVLDALVACSEDWELVRLVRCREKGFCPERNLPSGRALGTNTRGLSFAAAYLVNRRGAERILRVLSRMVLPYDLALYQGWPGIRERSVLPDVLTMDSTCEETTLGKKSHTWLDVIFGPTKLFFKLWIRLRRARFQKSSRKAC